MDLLRNAVESIQVGIEDYNVGTAARLRSCVRSIHAGILLLFKERLRQLSPPETNELLLKARYKAVRRGDGAVVLIGDGRRTVDVPQIKERFGSLEIDADWSRVDRITQTRNDIEHYYPKVSQTSLHTLIADAFVVIRDFVRSELNEDPRTASRRRFVATDARRRGRLRPRAYGMRGAFLRGRVGVVDLRKGSPSHLMPRVRVRSTAAG